VEMTSLIHLVYVLVFFLVHVKTQTEFPEGKVWSRELMK